MPNQHITTVKNHFKDWYERNKHSPKFKAQRNLATKKYQEQNPERFKEQQKRYQEKHKDLISLRRKRDRLFMRRGKGEDVEAQIVQITELISSYKK